MDWLVSVLNWFAGNGQYMKLTHCMGGDTFWVVTTVVLDLANAAGYSIIALHWWQNSRHLPKVPAKSALANIRNIFVFCGICGYIFIPIKMVWPAWRLYDITLAVLVFYTWRYALGARDMKVVYSALGRSTQLQEDLKNSLEQSKRKSRFLNAISHDMRTPLNGLVLSAQLAELNLHDTEMLKEALVTIRSSAAATGALLDHLLEFARMDFAEDENAISNFPLHVAIDQCIGASKATAQGKGLDLRASCPENLRICSDRNKIERILSNLVSNAIKYTSQGSVKVLIDYSRDGVEIHVVDTGVGIEPDEQSKIFEEFYQINNHERDRNKGFGLGLSISRRLARQLGGDIVVDSAPGKGSRFTLVIPQPAHGSTSIAGPASRPAETAAA